METSAALAMDETEKGYAVYHHANNALPLLKDVLLVSSAQQLPELRKKGPQHCIL